MKYSQTRIFTNLHLNLWSCDLDPWSTWKSCLYQSFLQVSSTWHPIIRSWMINSKNNFFTKLHMTFTFDLVILTFGRLQPLIVINHVSKYDQYPVIGLWYKVEISFFYKPAYLTLTFNPVTSTMGQLQHFNDINYMCKCHQDPIISSWYVVDFFTNLHIWPWPLILWPWPLVIFCILLIIIMCISIINNQSLVNYMKSKQLFSQTWILELDLWPCDLDLW